MFLSHLAPARLGPLFLTLLPRLFLALLGPQSLIFVSLLTCRRQLFLFQTFIVLYLTFVFLAASILDTQVARSLTLNEAEENEEKSRQKSIHVPDSVLAASVSVASVTMCFKSNEEKEKEENIRHKAREQQDEKNQKTTENDIDIEVIDGEDWASLSDYDVSMLSASQLFECVNLPENMSQYATNEAEEEEEEEKSRQKASEELEAKEDKSRKRKENKDNLDNSASEHLSQFDVSMFSASRARESPGKPITV
jgi:hypothetical protein